MLKPVMTNILFLDIETVPQSPSFDDVAAEWKELWTKKAEALLRNRLDETVDSIYSRAGIYAEFGKIICISVGVIQQGNDPKLIIKSFFGEDERSLLLEFVEMLKRWSGEPQNYLCAHNGKEFDFPFICRRLIINHIPIPPILNTAGKKPWEVNHLDTMELWKFGDFKNYTSLNLLAHALGIPTPKDDIDGSMVGEVYWKEKNIRRIANYCEKDVITVAQVYLRIVGEKLVTEIEIKS
ncbi:MAG: 3'-5' exonuclease [Chitinophagaceae bacterium]|nr:3'-5' exonuclease [Chitinophagaceae bacterium]